MTITKPLAPHGTYARYTGRPNSNIPGCRCTPCTDEGRRYIKRRDLLAATGRPLTVDATRARQHLTALLAGGGGWNQIGAASQCSSSTISTILAGRPEIRRTTEQKILNVRLDQVLPPDRSVPALGAIRRVQALAAIGHSGADIATVSGISDSLICGLLAGKHQRVFSHTHTAIARTFSRLAMTPGNSRQAINRAKREGWAPPLAWDDDMDDPDAAPSIAPALDDDDEPVDEVAVARLARGDRTIQLPNAEKPTAARHLAERGLTPWAISKSLHVHIRAVRAWLEHQPVAA